MPTPSHPLIDSSSENAGVEMPSPPKRKRRNRWGGGKVEVAAADRYSSGTAPPPVVASSLKIGKDPSETAVDPVVFVAYCSACTSFCVAFASSAVNNMYIMSQYPLNLTVSCVCPHKLSETTFVGPFIREVHCIPVYNRCNRLYFAMKRLAMRNDNEIIELLVEDRKHFRTDY